MQGYLIFTIYSIDTMCMQKRHNNESKWIQPCVVKEYIRYDSKETYACNATVTDSMILIET